MEATAEIRREKVTIPMDWNVDDLIAKYGMSRSSANRVKKQGWFVKNYMRKQVIIDRENFRPEICYSIAKQVFFRNFRRSRIAVSIKDDLIQEAVTLMFMQSGKVKETANEKYNARYGYWWVAHNAMIAYLRTWSRQTQYNVELENEIHPMMTSGNRRWSPDYGWMYC
jgi:hypothetical protein